MDVLDNRANFFNNRIKISANDILEPSQVSTCKMWLQGNYLKGKSNLNFANGDPLGAAGLNVKDLSASAMSLSQSTSGFRPTFELANNSILFDGSDDYLDTGVTTLGKNLKIMECVAFLKLSAVSANNIVIQIRQGSAQTARFSFAFGANTLALRYSITDGNSASQVAVPFLDTSKYNFFHARVNYNTGVARITINNSTYTFSISTGTTSNTNNANSTKIGTNIPITSFFSGNINHLSYYEGATELTDEQVRKIRNYIYSKL
jgi:hypothetical protein